MESIDQPAAETRPSTGLSPEKLGALKKMSTSARRKADGYPLEGQLSFQLQTTIETPTAPRSSFQDRFAISLRRLILMTRPPQVRLMFTTPW
jgi:hypothetical protein